MQIDAIFRILGEIALFVIITIGGAAGTQQAIDQGKYSKSQTIFAWIFMLTVASFIYYYRFGLLMYDLHEYHGWGN